MSNKAIRLAKAISNETVRRIPYIILVLVILSLVQFVRLTNKTAEGVRIAQATSVDSKTLLKKVAALSEDNKRLTQQNIQIARQNAMHVDCLADLFARYTRDQSPIYAIDLQGCIIQENGQKPATPEQTSARPSKSNQTVSSASSSQTIIKQPPGQPNIPQSPPLIVVPLPHVCIQVGGLQIC